jgi:hypothetical protein
MVAYESKSVFWQALIVTIVIFAAGLVLGYYLESSRATGVEISLLGSEMNLLDEQMRAKIIGDSNVSCDLAVESTFAFADKIYGEALKLEQYGASSKFTNEVMLVLHRRYDLLRMMLWDESVKLKARCGGFHTVVYFFDYNSEDMNIKARQAFFSNILLDVKNGRPGEVLLIPIASNLDLASVDLAMENYQVSMTPSVLIDERKIVGDIVTFDEMSGFVFSGNKTTAKK